MAAHPPAFVPVPRVRRPAGTACGPDAVRSPAAAVGRVSPNPSSHLRDEAELWPLVVNRERVAEHRDGEPALPTDREPLEGNASVAVSIRLAR